MACSEYLVMTGDAGLTTQLPYYFSRHGLSVASAVTDSAARVDHAALIASATIYTGAALSSAESATLYVAKSSNNGSTWTRVTAGLAISSSTPARSAVAMSVNLLAAVAAGDLLLLEIDDFALDGMNTKTGWSAEVLLAT